MIGSAKKLMGLRLKAVDGEIGKVKDVYFDDHTWTIRYLVVDTGHWLPGRMVLISPQSVGEPDWSGHILPVSLTKEKIETSPDIDADQPVSRQIQSRLAAYYQWTPYWGTYAGPAMTWLQESDAEAQVAVGEEEETHHDPHLRSISEVLGYEIHASDGQIGHVRDFLVQSDGWVIRYMVVKTGHWLAGRNVLVSPTWITDLEWTRAQVDVDLPRQSIQAAPEFDIDQPLSREYEDTLHDHYERPKYWKP